MNYTMYKKTMTGLLLATTALSVPGYADQDTDKTAALENRVAHLEALITRLLDRMDTQEVAVSERRQATEKVKAELKEVKAASGSPDARPKDGFMLGNTHVKFGGYLKADMIALKNTDGPLARSASIVRDFYIPSTIPVGGDSSDWVQEFSARQTRLFMATNTKLGDKAVGTKLEMDFNVTDGGDERISNSYSLRIRHGFITYDKWLFGQTWSTFMDAVALPDSLDFIGTTEGALFVRQPIIRYTSGPFQIAVEQPETTVTSVTGSRVLSGNDPIPDVVLRYNYKRDWGYLSLSGISRSLNLEAGTGGIMESDSIFGYGLSLSGKIKMAEKDDLRLMLTAGEGLGRYVALNAVNDVVVSPDGTSLETVGTLSGFASYRHFWDAKSRSNLMLSYFKADNPIEYTGDAVTDEIWSVRGNYIYSPFPRLDLGLEYGYSKRSLENGLDGAQHRVQFTSKFSF